MTAAVCLTEDITNAHNVQLWQGTQIDICAIFWFAIGALSFKFYKLV